MFGLGERLNGICPYLSLFCLAAVLSVAGKTVGSPAWGAEGPHRPSELERIAALLDAVERSGVKFIREGKEYSAKDARKHLERKLRYAGDRVKTAEEFIDGIATRSSTTGRPYLVRLPAGEKVESAVWFRQRLTELDSRR